MFESILLSPIDGTTNQGYNITSQCVLDRQLWSGLGLTSFGALVTPGLTWLYDAAAFDFENLYFLG